MLKNRHYTINSTAMNRILDVTDIKRKEPNFANARELRNILDQVIMCQNLRTVGIEDKELGIVDVNKYIQDSKINLPITGEGTVKRILTGEEELEQLIGLASVKRMIKKIKAYAKKNSSDSGFNLHMCFYGNPGTGKTEVARILSRILYDAGVLPEAKLIETDSTGLLGQFVGETGPKTQRVIQDAMGGVLFIDEAYAVSDRLKDIPVHKLIDALNPSLRSVDEVDGKQRIREFYAMTPEANLYSKANEYPTKQTYTFTAVRCDRRKQEKPVPEIDSRAGCFIG